MFTPKLQELAASYYAWKTKRKWARMVAYHKAISEGKTIECRNAFNRTWTQTEKPTWDFQGYTYRVKPEPREWWLVLNHHAMPFAYTEKQSVPPTVQQVRVREVLE